MMQEQAVVVAINGQKVSVETERQSSCGQCSARSGCGSALLGKFFNRNKQHLIVETDLSLVVGDKILLGLDENALLRGSFIVYAIPLLMMLLLPMIVGQFVLSEAVSILSAAVGFSAGIIYVKYFSIVARSEENFSPVVLKRLEV